MPPSNRDCSTAAENATRKGVSLVFFPASGISLCPARLVHAGEVVRRGRSSGGRTAELNARLMQNRLNVWIRAVRAYLFARHLFIINSLPVQQLISTSPECGVTCFRRRWVRRMGGNTERRVIKIRKLRLCELGQALPRSCEEHMQFLFFRVVYS